MNKTVLRRYSIVSAYIHNQTEESWETMKTAIRRLEGHGNEVQDEELFRQAVHGLTEFHPELKDKGLVASIRVKVGIPDTGNRQADYENVRNQVERLLGDETGWAKVERSAPEQAGRSRVKCVQVEYDLDYLGGDYPKVGQFAYVPVGGHRPAARGKGPDRKLRTAFTVLVGDPRTSSTTHWTRRSTRTATSGRTKNKPLSVWSPCLLGAGAGAGKRVRSFADRLSSSRGGTRMKCPCCASRLYVLLGRLGCLVWYRCRSCGIDYNRIIRRKRHE